MSGPISEPCGALISKRQLLWPVASIGRRKPLNVSRHCLVQFPAGSEVERCSFNGPGRRNKPSTVWLKHVFTACVYLEEELGLDLEPYAIEGQLDVACVQRGRPLIRADDGAEVLEAGVDFHQEAFVLISRANRSRRRFNTAGRRHTTENRAWRLKRRRQLHLEDVFDDPLLVVVASLQVLHVELEQIQRSGA